MSKEQLRLPVQQLSPCVFTRPYRADPADSAVNRAATIFGVGSLLREEEVHLVIVWVVVVGDDDRSYKLWLWKVKVNINAAG